jgi:nucleotide-binding universal stress UspA family protein
MLFSRILVALDHSPADQTLLGPVKELASLTGAGILLLHVSTGWAAQWQSNLNLSDSAEMREDREYLASVEADLSQEGVSVSVLHAKGSPAEEILKTARAERCDLIAMATHGHKLISDILYGQTIDKVRHESRIPMFIVPGKPK